jgi:hypothetical protein
MKTLHALLMFVWLVPAIGQMKSEYQPGTILAVVPRQSKTADEITSYDVSVRVANTVYVCLYTPPPGSGTPLYAAGREMLFKVGEKSMTLSDMAGASVEVPIESKTPVEASAPQFLDVDSPSTLAKSTLVIGLTGVKENTPGELGIEEGNLHFVHSKNESYIPISSIVDLVTGGDSQRLVRGAVGTVSQFGPYGSGRFLSLFRSKLDTLTVQYRDSDEGLHGAIFTLPSGKSEAVKARLLAAGAHIMVPSISSLPETSKLADETKHMP